MFRITQDLEDLIESGVACIVGTGDDSGRPHIAYGWAPRVARGRQVDVFLDAPRAERTLANLRSNGRIAMTVSDPISYRSVQLKGTFRQSGEPTKDDREYVAARREGFLIATMLIGDPPGAIRNLWMDEIVRVSFSAECAFDQTPGPEAGKPL